MQLGNLDRLVSKKDRKRPNIQWFALDLSSSTLLLLGAILISSCGTVTDARALLHENALYVVSPDVIGPEGPLTPGQAKHVIEEREAHQ